MELRLNIGLADRVIRLALAVALIILVYTNVLFGIFAAIGLIAAFLLTATSLLGFCPLYALIKCNSIKEKSNTKP